MRRSTLFSRLLVAAAALGSLIATAPSSPVDAAGGYWVAKTAAANNRWQGIAYGAGLYVAVSDNGTERVMTSPDGITWTARTAVNPDQEWKSITFGNNTFVAVGYNGVMTSPNGIDWTAQTAPSKKWGEVRFLNNLFVALSWDAQNDHKPIMTSPDGVTWTEQTMVISGSVNWTLSNGAALAYGNNKYVALSQSGAWSRLATSTNGTTWTARNTSADLMLGYADWRDVTFAGGKFVAVGARKVATSTDGETWTEVTGDVAQHSWESIVHDGTKFVAVDGSGTKKIATSTDGTTWTIVEADIQGGVSWSSITHNNGVFVGVAYSGMGVSTLVLFSDSDQAPAPTVTSISPATGLARLNAYPTITGTGFRTGATVTIGGRACDNVSVSSSTSISCMLPAGGTAGAADVVVTNVDGQSATLTGGFTLTGAGGATQSPAPSTTTTVAATETTATTTPATNTTVATGSGGAASYENAVPGITKTDTKVYSTPPTQVASNSAITVLSPSQTKVLDIETRTPSVCVPSDDELVFLDEGRCISNVVNATTRKVLRTLRTTVVGDDITDLRVGNAIVTLAPIYFDFVSSTVNTRALARLKAIESRVSAAGSVLVIGHSGTLNGNSPENVKLSQDRARNTVAALKRLGAKGPFATSGVGALDPASNAKTEAAQTRNRRVVIALIP